MFSFRRRLLRYPPSRLRLLLVKFLPSPPCQNPSMQRNSPRHPRGSWRQRTRWLRIGRVLRFSSLVTTVCRLGSTERAWRALTLPSLASLTAEPRTLTRLGSYCAHWRKRGEPYVMERRLENSGPRLKNEFAKGTPWDHSLVRKSKRKFHPLLRKLGIQ